MFFSRKVVATELLRSLDDCHSHILPGVDDGVQSVEEALQVLAYYEQRGVRRVIFTPHVMEDLPRNSAERLRGEFEEFISLYSGGVELSLAAEYMLDGGFVNHLSSGDLLPLFDNYLLIEFSYAEAPINYMEILAQVMSSGYFVVLAHPERYLYLSDDEYRELRQMGVLFQLNIPSLLGCYGRSVKRRAERLLDSSSYDFVGSDLHSLAYHTELLKGSKIRERYFRKVQSLKYAN